MNWQASKLNPPIWWQAHLAGGLLEISIQYYKHEYHASIGRGLSMRQATFPTLSEAQQWGTSEARKVVKQIYLELRPTRYYLIEVCLALAILLLLIWLYAF
ncbi:hypothetical protein [Anabaena sp. CCY 9910]|uniref:hypothetical protein n=1 Tax=Anabaena sp. CCY 9910 TaxID=3103870 RepID=UPI0039E063D2